MSLPNKQISHPPIEFKLTDSSGHLTTQHMNWLNSIKPTLENTITNSYIQTPQITSSKISNISNPQFGMDVYDTDADKRRVNEAGTWKYYNTSTSPLSNSTPGITSAQRDSLTATNGDFIYNSDTHAPQIYVNGAWKTVTVS